jgi:hypothetical protein
MVIAERANDAPIAARGDLVARTELQRGDVPEVRVAMVAR